MECILNFETRIFHLDLKAKQSNNQIGKEQNKKLCPCFLNTVKKMNLLVLWNRIMTGATVSIKNIMILMVFFTYKYLNVEINHLKVISTKRTNIRKYCLVLSVAASTPLSWN